MTVATTDARVQRLDRLLHGPCERFGAYQDLPDAVVRAVPSLADLGYAGRQLALDRPRCAWLLECLGDRRGFSVVEIGASLGYFSLSLAADRAARATLYEPIEAYAETAALMAELAGLGASTTCHCAGVSLDAVEALPDADLLISLNVLHHAGAVFDQAAVAAAGSWRAYALDWLTRAARKYGALFLQTGNKSSGPALFDSAEAVPFVAVLLREAGWRVEAVGAIRDYDALVYDTWREANIADVPATRCRRNPETGLVDYLRDDTVVASLPKGLAQRPLWFCRSDAAA